MGALSPKVSDRLIAGIKKFQPILINAKSRDVNESDTVIIITDMLSYIFGYDKYSEITSEHAIRGTFVDLAIKLDGKLQILIEVKAIGLDLKDAYVKQAVDYAANQGVEWVILTNGINWKIFKIYFSKPIEQEVVVDFDFLNLNSKTHEHLDFLFFICREGWLKSAIVDYHTQKQALSKFYLSALITGNSVLDVIRRELRKVSPNIKIENEQVRNVLIQEVLKREVVEGNKAEEAKRKVLKIENRLIKNKNIKVLTSNPANDEASNNINSNEKLVGSSE